MQDGASKLGLGTGLIVSEDGYILTNEHVSGKKNSTCYITLSTGKIIQEQWYGQILILICQLLKLTKKS